VSQHDDEEQAERDGWHDEEVGGHDLARMIGEERAPRLRGRGQMASHGLGDGGLTDGDAQLLQLAMNPRRTPERISESREGSRR
jgi:hypothetical protein